MKNNIYPKLTVLGAGPGDKELITLKGVKALSQANVVLYDALVNEELLSYVPKESLKIYVGKRNSNHEYTQEQINNLIVDFAFTHGNVVRLKGGDPFVFGRGKEELDYAEAFNIPTEFIPGISSSISVPGIAGIPVTHRGVSESFWVITGTTKEGKLSKDVIAAAKTNATVVILMGLNKIAEITEVFKNSGKGNTSVAIIQDGSLPSQKTVIGDINTIEGEVKKNNIQAPAVIVIGDVVNKEQVSSKVISNYLFSTN
jgi:uroporphyrin-III C-methyltransferase